LTELGGNAKLRTELACAGRQQARQFSWERNAEQLIGIYRDVLRA
jgi:glycosyltransferase involved in cell wall biosynthesis